MGPACCRPGGAARPPRRRRRRRGQRRGPRSPRRARARRFAGTSAAKEQHVASRLARALRQLRQPGARVRADAVQPDQLVRVAQREARPEVAEVVLIEPRHAIALIDREHDRPRADRLLQRPPRQRRALKIGRVHHANRQRVRLLCESSDGLAGPGVALARRGAGYTREFAALRREPRRAARRSDRVAAAAREASPSRSPRARDGRDSRGLASVGDSQRAVSSARDFRLRRKDRSRT